MIRELELKDRENVLEVVKDIWEGEDYIPTIFNSWVSDSDCHFMGMWKDEALVGVANLRRLSPTVGWLEGMRIKPELQGKGYGRELAEEMMRLARNEGLEELYFSTYFDNLASIKINESLGFSRVAVFTNLELELKPSVDLEIELKYAGLQIGQEIPEIEAYMSNDWFFVPPEIGQKRNWLKEPEALSREGNMAVVSRNPKFFDCMEINYIELDKGEDAENFLSLLAGYAREKGYSRVHTMVPESVELDPFLKNRFAPFERFHDVFIYRARIVELRID